MSAMSDLGIGLLAFATSEKAMRSACFRYGFRLGLFPMCRCGDWVSDDCGGKEVAFVEEFFLTTLETAMWSITFQKRQMVATLTDMAMRSQNIPQRQMVCLHSAKAIGCDTFRKREKVAPFGIGEMVAVLLPMSAPLQI